MQQQILLIYKDISIASFTLALICIGYLAGTRCAQNAECYCGLKLIFENTKMIFLWLIGSVLIGIFWFTIPPSIGLGKLLKYKTGE